MGQPLTVRRGAVVFIFNIGWKDLYSLKKVI